MGVGAAVGDAETVLLQPLREDGAVLDHLLLQLAELLGPGQLEGQRDGSKDIDMRAALLAGEDCPVDLARQSWVGGQDAGAARAAQAICGW